MIPAPTVPGATYDDHDSDGMSVLLWGAPGSWKTTWSAQWPGVVFLSVVAEGGDDALKEYPRIAADLINKSQNKECPPVFNTAKPPVIKIKTAQMMADKIEEICKHHKAWKVCTVVVDSLSYLIDLWIDDWIQNAEKTNATWNNKVKKQGGELLGPKEWGLLNMYLRGLRVKLSNEGLNVIWTCLQKEVYKSDPSNMAEQTLDKVYPMITGATKVSLPGSCKLHIHADVGTKVSHPTAMGRLMVQPTYWTASNAYVTLRHRYYLNFPKGCLMDPEFGTLPTFRAVWAELHPYIYVGK